MLNRQDQKSLSPQKYSIKKIGFIVFLCCSVFIFSACGGKKQESTGTGNTLSGENTNATSASLSGNDTKIQPSGTQHSQPGSGKTLITTGSTLATGGAIKGSLKNKKQVWFPIEECNKIVAFDLCVISKAPIENQPVMREQLKKTLEPWKLLVDAQLREVCSKVINNEVFQEVVVHYGEQENGCKF